MYDNFQIKFQPNVLYCHQSIKCRSEYIHNIESTVSHHLEYDFVIAFYVCLKTVFVTVLFATLEKPFCFLILFWNLMTSFMNG